MILCHFRNKVYYQKDHPDQFIHRYSYDGDNRITAVHTSRDGIVWTKDAAYEYYAHGPLARTIIGDSLEKQDYAYTLQGWIKGIRGENFSYSLGYHAEDYKSLGQNNLLATPVAQGKDLYNGNIATMASLNPKLSEQTWTQQFGYDQLNRIIQSSTLGGTHINSYKTSYNYDANGNIERLQRYNEQGDAFDSLVYHYENKAKGYLSNTNKLRWVDDNPALSGNHDEDLEDQSADNYAYDAIGNLVADVSEEIERIEWTVYGKVKAIHRKSGSQKPDLEFGYDATGNRISKKVIHPKGLIKITYYIRDASGNVMAVYEKPEMGDAVRLEEQYIYGSSRLGVVKGEAVKNKRVLGLKSYELTDHLGNVRAIIRANPTALGLTEMVAGYDYLPFGFIAQKEDAGYRFGQGGQEKVGEIHSNHYTAEYWEYDSRLGRRWNLDPKPNISQSSYLTFNNNPILHIDILGDTAYQFRPDGSFLQKFDDGKEEVIGQFFQNEKKNYDENGNHKTTTYTNPISFKFNDFDLDRNDLIGLESGQLVSFTVDGIDKMVDQTKARSYVNKSFQERKNYLMAESVDGNSLDYSGKIASPLKTFNLIDGVLYNTKDAGNFVWGYTASILKFSHIEVRVGSEYYAWAHGKSSNAFEDNTEYSDSKIIRWFQEKTWTGDSKADQKAIMRGYYLKNRDAFFSPYKEHFIPSFGSY